MDRLRVFSKKLGFAVPVSNIGGSIKSNVNLSAFEWSNDGWSNYSDKWLNEGWNNYSSDWMNGGWNNYSSAWMNEGWNNYSSDWINDGWNNYDGGK